MQGCKAIAASLACLALAACETVATVPPSGPAEALEFATAPLAVQRGQSGGVFSPLAFSSLTSDSRAFRPGDVLTVVLQETTQASKKTGTSTGKNSSASVAPSVLLGKTLKTDIGIDAQRHFDSSGSSMQQNTLQGAITVVVQEVLPNGLLQIRGEKSLTLNQGEEFIRVSGYVRVADIDTDNRLSSQRIANARIVYSGRGALAETQRQGWLMTFFNGSWMPF
ncbi:flagellar basal body L-ring protein [Acidovorax sp. SRB_14]|uniref:flagellar basal body L-ring protein FlgH n=1 Tax=Acidovorax sp. SRB_14 TaxID=1962699 RepID=UPI0015660942|nr:flagellar basal body L-ring protein FlgH [Acidovorax sp. SRB_14]NMM79795.1 flagellar basal body L-ring protein [Acidovorax sp. SRB_14]